ncbi:MAG: extracellular solute-binding protein [Alphaproteobacteria bacterium]
MTSSVMRPLMAASLAGALIAGGPVVAQEASPLRVAVPAYGPDTAILFGEIAEAFEAEHPDIDVRIEPHPWDDLFQALSGDLSAGTPPDLAIVGFDWLSELVEEGALAPLEARVGEPFAALFVSPLLDAASFDGHLWALPAATSARALFVNRDLLARAGVGEAPASWAALEEAAAKVAALGDGTAGFALQGSEIETDVYFYHALWSLGGSVIAADGSSGLDGPAALEAARTYRRMIENGLTQAEPTRDNRSDVEALFVEGRAAMAFGGPWLIHALDRAGPGFVWDAVPVPAGSTRATYAVTDSMVLFADAAAPDAALRFMEFAFQPVWRIAFLDRHGFLPATRAELENAREVGDPRLAAFFDSLPDARFTPALESWAEVADLTTNALRRIYAGDATPEDALAATAAEIDRVLAR